MFQDALKKARLAKGLSQKVLANHIFVSQQAYAKYETGASTPNPDTLGRIVTLLDISADDLLETGVDREKPTPVSESGPSDDELIRLWTSLSPAETLRVKDFALGMIANRKEPPARPG